MFRRITFLILSVVFLSIGATWAEVPITVENYSFEDPNIGKVIGWDLEDGAHLQAGGDADVPGWESDGSIDDSGVESGYITEGADGDWTGFLMSQDPGVYNLTNFVIGDGDIFELEVDAQNNWEATSFEISLYYDDNGARITAAANTVTVEDSMVTYSVTFVADDFPASYDHEIGIELNNVSSDLTSWVGMDNVRLTLTSSLYRAYNPYPEHKGSYEGEDVNLTWSRGPNLSSADSYHVYISSDRNEVVSNDPNADMGLVSNTSFLYENFVQGLTYYWRVDTIRGSTTYRGSTWRFSTKSMIANNPEPSTGAEYLPVNPTLSWDAGTRAFEGHVVIFGDSYAEVNDAPVGISGTEPPYRLFLSDVSDTSFTPEETGHPALDISTVYYWRVDTIEVNPGTILKGEVWEFQTVPIAGLGSITREVWMGITGNTIANLTNNPDYPDNPTNTNYPTSFDAPRRTEEVDYGTRMHGWLYVETTGDYTFWIAADDVGELWLDDELIATASASGYHQWSTADEQQSDPIHLEAGNLYYIMALQKHGGGTEDSLGVAWSDSDDVRNAEIITGRNLMAFDQYVQKYSHRPSPYNNLTDLPWDVILSWAPGEYAAAHDVYFGADEEAVRNATTASTEYRGQRDIGSESYDPGILEFDTTYYWRIDEVNDLNPESPWTGKVWSFTVGNYIVVEDFENYSDYPPNEIWNTWIDGYGDPTNGSTAGYPNPDFVGGEHYLDEDVVHGGDWSMPFFYDNSSSGISEVTRTFASSMRDWTRGDVITLTLFYNGSLGNDAELMYVTLNGDATITNDYSRAALDADWTRWDILLQDFADVGVDLTNVDTMTIGFGNKDNLSPGGGSGIVFFDDIRLYRSEPIEREPEPEPVDPGTGNLVASYSFENNVRDNSGNGLNGIIVGNPAFVEGIAGMGLSFDGVNDYVDLGNDESFDISEQISLSAWVNTNDSGNSEDNPYVVKGDHTYGVKHYASNQIQFFIYDGSWYTANVGVDDSFNGEWHHVAGTYDGMELKVYVDGALSATTAHAGSIEIQTHNLNIARNSEEDDRFYDGVIDEVKIYNRALSHPEIRFLLSN